MSASKALYARLSADATISGLVGNRIIPTFAPKGQFPQIVYELGGADRLRSHDGPIGLVKQRVTLSCISSLPTGAYNQAQSLANAVKDALENQGGTWGGVVVRKVFFQDDDDAPFTDPETNLVYQSVDQEYDIWFEG